MIRDEAAARGPIARGMIIISQGRRMARALQILGFEIYEGAPGLGGDQLFYTTPDGVAAIPALLYLTEAEMKWARIARLFAWRPGLFNEYRAAFNLGADDDTLRGIFNQTRPAAKPRRRRRLARAD